MYTAEAVNQNSQDFGMKDLEENPTVAHSHIKFLSLVLF
jgi:hypothetical protein